LLRTHKDLHSDPRYRAAVDFFTDELYGSGDPRARDRDLLRVERMMERLLPPDALAALCLAIELEVLTQELDVEVVRALPDAAITEERYAEAYRAVGRREDRERQIDLMYRIGQYLDGVVKKPMVRALVHLARGPAHAAGFGGLQDFLERGLAAFERMGGAAPFLAAIRDREQEAMEGCSRAMENPRPGRKGIRMSRPRRFSWRSPAVRSTCRPTHPAAEAPSSCHGSGRSRGDAGGAVLLLSSPSSAVMRGAARLVVELRTATRAPTRDRRCGSAESAQLVGGPGCEHCLARASRDDRALHAGGLRAFPGVRHYDR
jgi:hypothetical protein